jgi:hypothetical protein
MFGFLKSNNQSKIAEFAEKSKQIAEWYNVCKVETERIEQSANAAQRLILQRYCKRYIDARQSFAEVYADLQLAADGLIAPSNSYISRTPGVLKMNETLALSWFKFVSDPAPFDLMEEFLKLESQVQHSKVG